MLQPLCAGVGSQSKKLIEATLRWARSRRTPQTQTNTDAPDPLASLNAKLGIAPDNDEEYFIWPEHEEGWLLFMRFVTQVRQGGMSGAVIGLDYTPVMLWLRDQVDDRKRRDELLQQVQWCEMGLLQFAAETAEMSK